MFVFLYFFHFFILMNESENVWQTLRFFFSLFFCSLSTLKLLFNILCNISLSILDKKKRKKTLNEWNRTHATRCWKWKDLHSFTFLCLDFFYWGLTLYAYADDIIAEMFFYYKFWVVFFFIRRSLFCIKSEGALFFCAYAWFF